MSTLYVSEVAELWFAILLKTCTFSQNHQQHFRSWKKINQCWKQNPFDWKSISRALRAIQANAAVVPELISPKDSKWWVAVYSISFSFFSSPTIFRTVRKNRPLRLPLDHLQIQKVEKDTQSFFLVKSCSGYEGSNKVLVLETAGYKLVLSL